jgi:hypothetical protein
MATDGIIFENRHRIHGTLMAAEMVQSMLGPRVDSSEL